MDDHGPVRRDWNRCEAGHCFEFNDSGDPMEEILIRNNRRPGEIISGTREELIAFALKVLDAYGAVPAT